MLGATIQVVVKIKTIDDTWNGIFKYSKDLRSIEGSRYFTIYGRFLPYVWGIVVYVYAWIFIIAILISSAISIVVLTFMWFVWFYGSILGKLFIKDFEWTVPHYMYGKKVEPKEVKPKAKPKSKEKQLSLYKEL